MKATLPIRLKDAISKTIAELATFLDAEVSIDTRNPEPGIPASLMAEGPDVYACGTFKVNDDSPVGFVFRPGALVHMGKTLLLIPYGGASDTEVNDEIIEAFGEVFNVIVGTWNRIVDERGRLKAARPGEAIRSFSRSEITAYMAEHDLDSWTFPLTMQNQKHSLSFYGPADWLGLKSADANRPAKPKRPAKARLGSEAESVAALAGDARADALASENSREVEVTLEPAQKAPPAPSAVTPVVVAPVAVTPVASLPNAAPPNISSLEQEEEEIDDDEAYLVPREYEDSDPVELTSTSAGPPAPVGAPAASPRAGESTRSTTILTEPVLLVDETGALANWLATQLEAGRLRFLKAGDCPTTLPRHTTAVVLQADRAGLDRLRFDQTFVIRAR